MRWTTCRYQFPVYIRVTNKERIWVVEITNDRLNKLYWSLRVIRATCRSFHQLFTAFIRTLTKRRKKLVETFFLKTKLFLFNSLRNWTFIFYRKKKKKIILLRKKQYCIIINDKIIRWFWIVHFVGKILIKKKKLHRFPFFDKFIIPNFYANIKVKVNSQKHLYSG